MTTATATRPRAMPSRRWCGSMSRARPTERAVEPAPLATISQVARAARPLAAAAVATGEAVRFLAGGLRRGAAGLAALAGFVAPFDLVVRAPERAAVLFAMSARLVATAPSAPSATRVSERLLPDCDQL